ncbi:MAG: DUF1153 domain-containing protein [Alphaproteobacteria bacterium]|nr:DUF1153 domain-containing protein [Alphaproteobacteria bacterium]
MAEHGKAGRTAEKTEIALPPADTRRWVISRKAQVVRAVETGILTEREACQRYDLTPEELSGWRQMVERHGVRGLRVTRLHHYREGQDSR